MGSAVGRSGNFGGKTYFDFTAAGQDSGPVTIQDSGIGFGWERYGFQLLGDGQNMAISVYGTWDPATARGDADNWFLLPAVDQSSGGAQWSNPMVAGLPANSALYAKAHIIAFRATSEAYLGQVPSGTATLCVFCTP